MKWFKHISDSTTDPFISELCEAHGTAGYYVFFGILEIYAREFKVEKGWFLSVTWNYIGRSLTFTRNFKIKKIVLQIASTGKWQVREHAGKLDIYIPKFRKFLDETTLKKLRLAQRKAGVIPDKSGDAPEAFRKSSTTEAEEEVEEDIKKENKQKKVSEPYLGDLSSQVTELAKQLARLSLAYPKNGHRDFNVNGLIQKFVNQKKHPQAIVNTVRSLVDRWTIPIDHGGIENPEGYAVTIMKTKSGNYYEQDHTAASQEFKNLEMPGELRRE